jgi:hypothetical protein
VATITPLPGLMIKPAPIWTVTCVEETKVYCPRGVVPFQLSDPPATKPEPFTVRVNGGLPAGTLEGESDVMVAPGIPCPPPPPPPWPPPIMQPCATSRRLLNPKHVKHSHTSFRMVFFSCIDGSGCPPWPRIFCGAGEENKHVGVKLR